VKSKKYKAREALQSASLEATKKEKGFLL